MPFLAGGCDLLVGEAAELVAHQDERLVVEGGIGHLAVAQQRRDALAHRGAVAEPGQCLHRVGAEGREIRIADAELVGTDDLALAHRDAAGHLVEIFTIGRLQHQPFQLAELAGCGTALGPAQHLAERFAIGREPGIAMGGELLFFEQGPVDAAARRNPRGHGLAHLAGQAVDGRERVVAKRQKTGKQKSRSPAGITFSPWLRHAVYSPYPREIDSSAAGAPRASRRMRQGNIFDFRGQRPRGRAGDSGSRYLEGRSLSV